MPVAHSSLPPSVLSDGVAHLQPGPLSLVESFIVMLGKLSYAIKNQLVAFSLVLYGIRDMGVHAREGPIIKNQRRARNPIIS